MLQYIVIDYYLITQFYKIVSKTEVLFGINYHGHNRIDAAHHSVSSDCMFILYFVKIFIKLMINLYAVYLF